MRIKLPSRQVHEHHQLPNYIGAVGVEMGPPSPPTSPPSPKVTVSLPKHAASRLRDLVQRRDIALLRLGIISVQFEDDQIIPLTLNTTTNSNQSKSQSNDPQEPSNEPSAVGSCRTECISLTTNIPALDSLSPINNPILEEDDDLETNMNDTESPILDSTIAVATSRASSVPLKTDCNTSNLAVYDDNLKEEDEVVNEVENQHSSYSQIQLGFAEELEMYDNDNLLFSDYTY